MTDERAKTVRSDCRFVMHAHRTWWCKLAAMARPQDGPRELRDGCPPDCADYQHAPWRVNGREDEA